MPQTPEQDLAALLAAAPPNGSLRVERVESLVIRDMRLTPTSGELAPTLVANDKRQLARKVRRLEVAATRLSTDEYRSLIDYAHQARMSPSEVQRHAIVFFLASKGYDRNLRVQLETANQAIRNTKRLEEALARSEREKAGALEEARRALAALESVKTGIVEQRAKKAAEIHFKSEALEEASRTGNRSTLHVALRLFQTKDGAQKLDSLVVLEQRSPEVALQQCPPVWRPLRQRLGSFYALQDAFRQEVEA